MRDMNCTEFEARLNELVEDHRRLDESAIDATDPESAVWRELRTQAGACPHCRRLWNEFALLDRVLPLCKDLTPQVDLVEAVMARLKENPPQSALGNGSSTHGSRRSIFPMLMMIAVAVLACFVFLYRPMGWDNFLDDTVPVAKNGEPKPEDGAVKRELAKGDDSPEIKSGKELDWQAMAADARSAYWALASDTADSFASVAVLAPAIGATSQNQAPAPAAKPPSGWTDGIGTGLKPVSQDVGQAMEFLFDVLPGENTL